MARARFHGVSTPRNRRDFVIDSSRIAIAAWAALEVPWLGATTACSPRDGQAEKALVRLTPAEARTMRAFAAQIIPSDDGGPGAEEAGAIQFVDRALGMPSFVELAPVVRAGLADLDVRARALGRRDFASLSSEQQVTVMREIEAEPFFAAARLLVVIGTLADPSHGGNRGAVGWMMIGMDHRPSYAAPFGWYDANAAAQRGKRVA
jgi:gluconate 2-dehydrogenase gamma chain